MPSSVIRIATLVVACTALLIAAPSAQAKGANYECWISGTFNVGWSGSCKLDSGGTVNCRGNTNVSLTAQDIWGRCVGSDPIFGSVDCSLKGKFTWIGGGTWKATGPVYCTYGVGFTCGPSTWTGSGVTGSAGAFKGRLDWFC